MSDYERLTDEQVATLTLLSQHCLYCDPAECGDKAIASLAREVQEWRSLYAEVEEIKAEMEAMRKDNP